MSARLLVVAELRDGRPIEAAREAVGAALALTGSPAGVDALAFGTAEPAALADLGAGRILHVAAPEPTAARAAAAAAAAAAELGSGLVLVGSTSFGRELTGRLAVRWEAAAATNVVAIRATGDGAWTVDRPVFGGRATEERLLQGPRVVVALRPHAFPPGATRGTPTVEARAAPEAAREGERLGFQPTAATKGPDLAGAAIVVAGGRGLGSPEKFVLVEELAESLGAAVGASRAVTDAGWRPQSLQVGQTGRSVSPQLYIAVGISGAIQHLVGMVGSRVIVAINSDAQAPIFRSADYGLVGDLFQLVPALTREIRRVRGLS